MRRIQYVLWATLLIPVVLWLAAEPTAWTTQGVFPLRKNMVQLTGAVAIAAMSVTVILAARPLWCQSWLGGLDKMYRLHKWLGISAVTMGVAHWLWYKGPKWLAEMGLLVRPKHGRRGDVDGFLANLLLEMRDFAKDVGEIAFYVAVALLVVALLRKIPYWAFSKVHKAFPVVYLGLVLHSVVLLRTGYWMTPLGIVLGALMAYGSWAAIAVLLGFAGKNRKAKGKITSLNYNPVARSLEIETEMTGWGGHKAGQFAFAASGAFEGAHPYTIASAWDKGSRRLAFVVKELGDHTSKLREKLAVGQTLSIEGPYGCFTFDDKRPRQVWVAGGIGMTPFIGRLEQLAMDRKAGKTAGQKPVDMYLCIPKDDPETTGPLERLARDAGVNLRVMVDSRDGFFTAARLREETPQWQEASVWFCGPALFGKALRGDLKKAGFPVGRHFHQELFEMR